MKNVDFDRRLLLVLTPPGMIMLITDSGTLLTPRGNVYVDYSVMVFMLIAAGAVSALVLTIPLFALAKFKILRMEGLSGLQAVSAMAVGATFFVILAAAYGIGYEVMAWIARQHFVFTAIVTVLVVAQLCIAVWAVIADRKRLNSLRIIRPTKNALVER